MAGNLLIEVAPGTPAVGEKPALGPVYRNVLAKDGFKTLATEGISTLYELFQHCVTKHADSPALGSRETVNGEASDYKWITYSQAGKQVEDLGSALSAVGVQAHGRCGIFGANSPEWMLAMQACNRQSVYCVPLYDSLGENAIEYIVHHSEATIVFVSTAKFGQLVQALPAIKDRVKTVVFWGEGAGDAANRKAAEDLGLKVYSYTQFIELGRSTPSPPVPPKPEDLCTIMYTSGTTGDPKGVKIPHAMVICNIAGQLAFLRQVEFPLGANDVMLSFLPLAHIFDRAAEECLLYLGAKVGYWRGDIKGLVDDIAALKPTIFIGVPRVFDRIYAGVLAKINQAGGLKAKLFHYGFNRKLHFLNQGFPSNKASPFFDKLVFSKIKVRLGGRVRIILTGGAPLSRHVEDFLKVTMCCPVVQGYGLTETCAASFIAVPNNPAMSGTVGPPLPIFEYRLEGVPEMKYDPLASPPRGEVCIRGPTVFTGYYKQQEKTDEVLDSDGWFHTGDIGEVTPAGALRIFDRKKNIFKLAQGEYIAVEKLESVFKKNPLVEQIWVYGNSFESTLVAVVVPVEEKLMGWAKGAGVSGSFTEVVKTPQAQQYVVKELAATGKEGKLKGFEMIKGVILETVQFGVENELMTPTFKLKRPQLQQKYQSAIDDAYKKINAAAQ
ncbi:hypothetical protein WJX72_009841 [[Myrmecia] bisecta]|uniref:Long-chain-fatty-acid--CoA ligase n=1 Tax=[Myrmecia] bisecta TaxID=41462 RepID=A0AAW1Q7Z4_9CHLO